jgi:predicted dienelactone hydrolase
MNKEIGLYVWYPAMLPKDAEPSRHNFDAEPDLSASPYPVILSSAKSGLIFGPHLATYGFVVVGVDGQDSEDNWGNWLIDFPLDQISALDQIASHQLDHLEGMIDSNRVGVLGYSLNIYNALALCGARIDPDFYQDQCASAVPGNPTLEASWIDRICSQKKMTGRDLSTMLAPILPSALTDSGNR